MMPSVIRRYQIGLAAIGLFTLIIVGLVIVQAGATRQDTATAKAADGVVTKLNNYVTEKDAIPSSLAATGASDVPDTISYQRLSDTRYKFCVTYKADSSGFDSSSAITDVVTGSLVSSQYSSLDTSSSDNTDSTYLYLPYTHHKGQNCQTIKPYITPRTGYYENDTPYTSTDTSLLDVYSGTQSKARDTERTTDLKTLQAQLEAYYAQNGNYPTLTEVNDSTWRGTNMPGMDKEALRDPQGSSYDLVSAPTKNAYSYEVTTDTGKTCTVAADCFQYVLTAKLESGSDLELDSLN